MDMMGSGRRCGVAQNKGKRGIASSSSVISDQFTAQKSFWFTLFVCVSVVLVRGIGTVLTVKVCPNERVVDEKLIHKRITQNLGDFYSPRERGFPSPNTDTCEPMYVKTTFGENVGFSLSSSISTKFPFVSSFSPLAFRTDTQRFGFS